jgi:hypothetical protein
MHVVAKRELRFAAIATSCWCVLGLALANSGLINNGDLKIFIKFS